MEGLNCKLYFGANPQKKKYPPLKGIIKILNLWTTNPSSSLECSDKENIYNLIFWFNSVVRKDGMMSNINRLGYIIIFKYTPVRYLVAGCDVTAIFSDKLNL